MSRDRLSKRQAARLAGRDMSLIDYWCKRGMLGTDRRGRIAYTELAELCPQILIQQETPDGKPNS